MSFESQLQQGVFSGNSEKTFIDKLLAKDDVNIIREIIKKKRLTREDMLEIIYMISGTESKLYNFGEYERYIILKLHIWIREFTKIAEQLYDYIDYLENKENFNITKRTQVMIDNILLLLEHNIKFLVDMYLNICRTSLSLGGTGFLEILNNRYEMNYSGNVPNAGQQVTQEKKGIFKRFRE